MFPMPLVLESRRFPLGSNPAHIKGAAAAVAVAEQVRRGMAWVFNR